MPTLVLHILITDGQAAEMATRRPVVGLLSVEEWHDLMNFHAALHGFSAEAADCLLMIGDGLERDGEPPAEALSRLMALAETAPGVRKLWPAVAHLMGRFHQVRDTAGGKVVLQ